MVYCQTCGERLPDDSLYCSVCGQKLSDPPKPRRRGRSVDLGWLDSVGFGVFLIAVAWVSIDYPYAWSSFLDWLLSLSGGLRMIPMVLVEPSAFFFTIMGIWQIAEGVIKGVSGARVGKAVADIVWGCGGIALAYLLKGYGAGTVDAANIGSYLVILFGVSVIASGLIGSFFYDN